MPESETKLKAPSEPIAILRSLFAVVILLGVMLGSTALAELFDSDFPTYFGTLALCFLPIAVLSLLYFSLEQICFKIAIWFVRRSS